MFILTTRALPDRATDIGVVAANSPDDLIRKVRQSSRAGEFSCDVHVAGGGRTIQSLLAAGVIDRLHLHVQPILVGSGVPLFEQKPTLYSADAWEAAEHKPPAESLAGSLNQLELVDHHAFADGVVELVYAPPNRPENRESD